VQLHVVGSVRTRLLSVATPLFQCLVSAPSSTLLSATASAAVTPSADPLLESSPDIIILTLARYVYLFNNQHNQPSSSSVLSRSVPCQLSDPSPVPAPSSTLLSATASAAVTPSADPLLESSPDIIYYFNHQQNNTAAAPRRPVHLSVIFNNLFSALYSTTFVFGE
jgi:hypothetical protein